MGATYAYAEFLTDRPVDFPDDNTTLKAMIDPNAKSMVQKDQWRINVWISVPFLWDVAGKVESDWKSKKKNKETVEWRILWSYDSELNIPGCERLSQTLLKYD